MVSVSFSVVIMMMLLHDVVVGKLMLLWIGNPRGQHHCGQFPLPLRLAADAAAEADEAGLAAEASHCCFCRRGEQQQQQQQKHERRDGKRELERGDYDDAAVRCCCG